MLNLFLYFYSFKKKISLDFFKLLSIEKDSS